MTEEKACSDLVAMKEAGALKLKDVTDDTDIVIFRIPPGLFQIKDLINKQISIGGNKPSKININGKKFEFVTRPFKGHSQTLWLPDSSGTLTPVKTPIQSEVCSRLCLERPTAAADPLEGLEHLLPVQHCVPDLPRRDFFGRTSPPVVSKHALDSSPTKTKKKKMKKTQERSESGSRNSRGFDLKPASKTSTSSTSAVLLANADHSAVPVTSGGRKAEKRKLSLEEVTPEVHSKSFKKKKRDKLVANFKNVYDDICASPASNVSSKSTSNIAENSLEKPAKKKKKSSSSDDSNAMFLENLTPENISGNGSSESEKMHNKKSKRKEQGEGNCVQELSKRPSLGLRSVYLTQSSPGLHSPLSIKREVPCSS